MLQVANHTVEISIHPVTINHTVCVHVQKLTYTHAFNPNYQLLLIAFSGK